MSTVNLDPLTNGSYWGPANDSAAELLLERCYLISGYMIGLFFGMSFIMYIACVTHFWQMRNRRGQRYTNFLIVFSTFLIILNIIYMVTGYISIEFTYIDYRNFPGGVVAFIAAQAVLPSNVLAITVLALNNILCDALLTWRCWVVWKARMGTKAWLGIFIPLLLAPASFALGLVFDIKTATPAGLSSVYITHIALSYFTLSLVLNVLLTAMIVGCILSHQRTMRRTLGEEHAKQYTSVTTMVIESAVIYTVDALLIVVTFAINSPLIQIWLTIAPPVQLIATLFIIWRLANGKAWTTSTGTTASQLQSKNVSGLVFASNEKRSRSRGTTDLDYGDGSYTTLGASEIRGRDDLPLRAIVHPQEGRVQVASNPAGAV